MKENLKNRYIITTMTRSGLWSTTSYRMKAGAKGKMWPGNLHPIIFILMTTELGKSDSYILPLYG